MWTGVRWRLRHCPVPPDEKNRPRSRRGGHLRKCWTPLRERSWRAPGRGRCLEASDNPTEAESGGKPAEKSRPGLFWQKVTPHSQGIERYLWIARAGRSPLEPMSERFPPSPPPVSQCHLPKLCRPKKGGSSMSPSHAGITERTTNRERAAIYEWLRRLAREATAATAHGPVERLRKAAEERLGREVGRRIQVDAPKISDLSDVSAWAVAYLCDVAKRAAGHAVPFDPDYSFAGYHPSIVGIRASIDRLATSPHPVLLIGERGTGKGQLMRAIHRRSDRSSTDAHALHLVSLAATTTTPADSELFGHEKSAFTGAVRKRAGAFGHALRSGDLCFWTTSANVRNRSRPSSFPRSMTASCARSARTPRSVSAAAGRARSRSSLQSNLDPWGISARTSVIGCGCSRSTCHHFGKGVLTCSCWPTWRLRWRTGQAGTQPGRG